MKIYVLVLTCQPCHWEELEKIDVKDFKILNGLPPSHIHGLVSLPLLSSLLKQCHLEVITYHT